VEGVSLKVGDMEVPGGVGGPDHPEDWKYSRVGTERAAAPSVPQYATRSACGGASRVSAKRNARGALAYAGDCACA
jgi:hypothetical protein